MNSEIDHSVENRRWMGISLVLAVFLLAAKVVTYLYTDSTAILSDAVESIVHLFAVVFAYYSVKVSERPADKTHPYGHSKIAFFSSGFEGLMIALAALYIFWEAINNILNQTEPQRLPAGIVLSALVLCCNLTLGWILLRTSRRTHSTILRSNGLHILTDAWTSAGVLAALVLVMLTGWSYWDPIVGIIIAANIFITGASLLFKSFNGLMDHADPQTEKKLIEILQRECLERGIQYHRLKFRDIGDSLDVDVDLLFPDEMTIRNAHEIATEIEKLLAKSIEGNAIISTHLEPIQHHSKIHPRKAD